MKFLDLEGLGYFATKILNKIPKKLSELTNDLGLKKVNSSTTNGNILIDDVETKVYTLPNATASVLGGVKVGTNVSVSNGTISIANGSTSAKGVVQLTDSITSTSTTTAATPNSVNSALLEAKQYTDSSVGNFGSGYLTGLSVNGTTITYTKGDGTTDSITTQDTNTVYTHPTTSGNKHIPSGGSSGQILRWASDGTAAWGADNNTTYTLSSFGVTATAAELNTLDGITATVTELNYTDGVTSNIQTQLNGKAPKYTYGTSAMTPGTSALATGTLYFQYE